MDLKQFVEEHRDKIQEENITNITKHKIEYIINYVDNWTYINENNPTCSIINFVDCMCNAGIYNDCTLSTGMRVLQIFVSHAKTHPKKQYNLFLNDISTDRIEVIKELSKIINSNNLENIHIFFECLDVNKYLVNISKYQSYFAFGSGSILFVDPYNFGDVNVNLLREFADKYYCELIFNYFSSDYKRNRKNASASEKIEKMKESMNGIDGYSIELNDDDVLKLIQNHFKKSKLKFTFAYQFRTKTNVPLYTIIYASRHPKGLEEIKESFWKIFEGSPFYRNEEKSKQDIETEQISLFDDRQMNEEYYCEEAKKLTLEHFNNQEVSYKEICIFLLENSMLRKGQVLRGVIKPLIAEGLICKLNLNGERNFTEDKFYIRNVVDEKKL